MGDMWAEDIATHLLPVALGFVLVSCTYDPPHDGLLIKNLTEQAVLLEGIKSEQVLAALAAHTATLPEQRVGR
jgi:hypothetical protein